jgi:c-di-GMP-binding flagellar brake protein YcgR
MISKRQYKRIIISGSATLEFKNIHSIQTLISNISLRGMGLYSYSSIKVETNVSITINFISLDGVLKTDSIEGRVINNRKIGNAHFLGIQFNEEMNAQNQPLLFKHIKNIIPTD